MKEKYFQLVTEAIFAEFLSKSFIIFYFKAVDGMGGPRETEGGFQFSDPQNLPGSGFNF